MGCGFPQEGRPAPEVNFGLASECLHLAHKARELTARVRSENNRHEILRRRAQYLHGHLRFVNEGSAMPLAESLNAMPNRIGGGERLLDDNVEVVPVNVLALDYWGLDRALLH